MYSVARFLSVQMPDDQCEQLGAELNNVIPGAYHGPRARGDGFACDVSHASSWHEQHAAIVRFIHRAAPVVAKAQAEGVTVSVDVGVDPEDRADRPYVSCVIDPLLGRVLAEANVQLEITIYAGASD
jgi:hypothetical protein